jgi:serine/threonine protein kinase
MAGVVEFDTRSVAHVEPAAGEAPAPSPPQIHTVGTNMSYQDNERRNFLDTVIAGRYKIRQEIGEGGMGSVYFAEQIKPIRRQVALKLVKPGMDSRTVLARFESERQALALMDHPHIAKVLDAGTTEQGRPFFVMELVKGIPLTEYCDRHRLDLPERLALFRQICTAIQHAHQKGVIHRDLKPTNILVESHDGKPVPKVIDFGLAKAVTGTTLSEHSLFTAFGSVTGTPLYMAPEQATFNAIDVDTRADIYALGVILYELLAGSTPIERETLQRGAVDEMLRVIREFEPPTPSSRISTSESLPNLAANRHVDPMRLSRLIRGDLDWIVMKALAKERNRRYDSAIAMANDVDRFLNHEPVSAGPPGLLYRLRKFVRRNRGHVAAAALILLALVGGIVGTTFGLIEARHQERVALTEVFEKEKARRAEAEQRSQADALRHDAEKRLTQVARMNVILGSIFRDLDPKNNDKEGKPLSAVLGERLDRATSEIEGDATGDPLTVARMQLTLGASQLGLGYPERAIELFTKANTTFVSFLGPDHPDTLASMADLARGYSNVGQLDRALLLREKTLELMKIKLGPDHVDTLRSLNGVASSYRDIGQFDRALRIREEVLKLRKAKLGPVHPDTLASMHNLAISYADTGRLDEALKLRETTLALMRANLAPDHPYTLSCMANLASSYDADGQHDRALSLREQTLASMRANLGPDHPDSLMSLANLANSYADAGRLDRALKLNVEAMELMRVKRGIDHPDTLRTMNGLAASYRAVGQFDRALKLNEEALERRTKILGRDHPDTIVSLNDLANTYRDFDRPALGLPLFEELLAIQQAKHGPGDRATLLAKTNLAECYQAAGRLDRAAALQREVSLLWKQTDGADSWRYAFALSSLGWCLLQQEKPAEAESILREALSVRQGKEPDAWTVGDAKALLGWSLLCQKRYEEAEPPLRLGYEAMKNKKHEVLPRWKNRVRDDLDRLIKLADETHKPNDARRWRDEKSCWLADAKTESSKP